MDRIDTLFSAALRTKVMTDCANGVYDDLTAEPRPDRVDRTDIGVLKDDDDVTVFGYQLARVVCAGPDVGWFYALYVDGVTSNPLLGQFKALDLTDRAPADPNEAPGTNAPGDPFSVFIPAPGP
jgi:hypothetical protein